MADRQFLAPRLVTETRRRITPARSQPPPHRRELPLSHLERRREPAFEHARLVDVRDRHARGECCVEHLLGNETDELPAEHPYPARRRLAQDPLDDLVERRAI